MAWATFEDINARWIGTGAPTDDVLVGALIADAEAVILSEFPGIQARIDDLKLSEAVVTMVVCRMVIRMLRNPEGLTSWQQNTGPFGQGRTFGTKDIWLTDEEEEMLAPKKRGKAFEVDVAPNALPGLAYAYPRSDSEFAPWFGRGDVLDDEC